MLIHSYQSCYDYEIDEDDNECSLMNPEVYDLNNYALGSDTIYTVDTPVNLPSPVYPNDKICFFEIGKRYLCSCVFKFVSTVCYT